MSGAQKDQFLDLLTGALVSGKSLNALVPSAEGQVVPHSSPYRQAEAMTVLAKTQGQWREQRGPQPATNPNKCRVCDFGGIPPFKREDLTSLK